MDDLFSAAARVEATLAPDWEARAHALDVRHSWIVEAPAGSGKTGLLIQRYLKLLSDENVDEPEQVLAITFTVKATQEMRERVLAQLESARAGTVVMAEFERETRLLAEAVLRRDAQRGWGLLEHPRRLNFRTIDSVCGQIAGALPVLSGGGGRQTPVEDVGPLYSEAARNTFLQLGGADEQLNQDLRTVLLHRDGSLADCERLLMELLPLRNQWGELVPLLGHELDDAYLDEVILPKIERAMGEAIEAGLAQFRLSVPFDILRELSLLAADMGHLPGLNGASPIAAWAGASGDPEEVATNLEMCKGLIHLLTTKSGGWRRSFQNRYLNFEAEKSQLNRLTELVGELKDKQWVLDNIRMVSSLPPETYPPEQWRVAKALFRVLSRALAELQLVFARQGVCDFAEPALLAKTALTQGGARDLSEILGMELRHLLVDEMQDTSTSQYELIELLTQGWDEQSQTVFLVGDPKQSIYLFRQARVERFVRTMQTRRLGTLSLGSLRLTANFRSQGGLVNAFNDYFSLMFPTEDKTGSEEVPYVEAKPVRGPSEDVSRSFVWHTAVLDSGEDAKNDRRRQTRVEARKVREIVEHWRRRPLPEGRSEPWKIAVIVRSRNLLPEIVAELKDETKGAIPFRAVDIEPLGERQEVLDLFALTRALLHPADRIAWFAVLRAPWCGLGLSELHRLAGEDEPEFRESCVEDLIRLRAELLSPESCTRLERIWTVMQAAQRRTGMTTSQLVEKTWRSLGGDSYLTAAEMANSRRFLQLLDEVEEQAGRIDFPLLKRRLRGLYADSGTAENAVDLITIHGAKGLEWDVVIVPGLEKRAQVNREKLLTWEEIDQGDDESASIVLAPIASRGEGSRELNEWLKELVKAREAAERKRLFYVACTRAREELHLFASPQRTAKGEIRPAHNSLLATAWNVADRYFETSAATVGKPTKIFNMPRRADWENVEEEFVGDLAAVEEPARQPTLKRLPLDFEPRARFRTGPASLHAEASDAPQRFERPEGSFEARAFGNAVHTFADVLAKRIAEGTGIDALLQTARGWRPRIAAALRADGLDPATVETLAARVVEALDNLLRDREGRWILSNHEHAASELALTSWDERRDSLRMDRVFLAGDEPLKDGHDYLWIVDYKTATNGREPVWEFLAQERSKYEEQLNAYARMMRDRVEAGSLRVGLYYPLLSRFVWWAPEMATVDVAD